jgi:hypothetical protein
MLNSVIGLITILGGGIFFVLSIYAIIDYSIEDNFGEVVKVIFVLALLVLSACSMISGYKLF